MYLVQGGEVVSDRGADVVELGRPASGHNDRAAGARACFREYGLTTDISGTYSALYRPYHLIGLELGISVASAALRGEPTGAPTAFNGDVVAVAKRDLKAGERLDGEGGYCVWGRLMPASDSLAAGALPIGLAHGLTLGRDVPQGTVVPRSAVQLDPTDGAVAARAAMERMFARDTP